MYVPNSNWKHVSTRPLSSVGVIHYAVERCRCGFETPERPPGSNETMKVVLGEQQQHEEEGCPPIPAEVIDALMAARETAESNMFARQAVMKIISDLDEYPAAVLWLYDNERRYIEAMDAMGERLAAERGA